MSLRRPVALALLVSVLASQVLAGDRPKGPRETEEALESALGWLVRHQDEDGHWDAAGFSRRCQGGACSGAGLRDFNVGLTGLAALALVKAGGHAEPARKAIDWLVAQQDGATGRFGPAYGELMYNHAIATQAVAEAFLRDKRPAEGAALEKAVTFLESARNEGLAWRYTPRCGQNDTSITTWCVQALVAARRAGVAADDACFQGSLAWLDKATSAEGETGYDRLGSGEIFVPGKNEQWLGHPTMTAAAIHIRCTVGDRSKAGGLLAFGSRLLLQDLPRWDAGAEKPTVDFYYWHHGTLAFLAFEGASGAGFKKWQKAVVGAIRPHQRPKGGCAEGSWDAEAVDRWAYAGGRVYATSLNALTLLASIGAGGEEKETPKEDPEPAKKAAAPADAKTVAAVEKALLPRVKTWLQGRENLRCLRCRGKQILPCPTCKGTGKVSVVTFGYGGGESTKACDRCGAQGKLRCCDDGLNKTKKRELQDKFGEVGDPIVDFVDKSLAVSVEPDSDGKKALVQHTVKLWGGESVTETSTWEADATGKWLVFAVSKK
jgi:hypothetical protein